MFKIYHLESRQNHLGWVTVFKELVDYYKNNYTTEVIYKYSDNTPNEFMYVPEIDWVIQDCELVIYNTEADIVKVISWREGPGWKTEQFGTAITKLQERNNPNDVLLVGHWESWFYDYKQKKNILPKVNFKIKPTTWYTFNNLTYELELSPIDFDQIYKERQNKILIDKLFWKSSTEREDPVRLAKLGICNLDIDVGLDFYDYLLEASKYKIGLAISSNCEKCYREIEYMAIGLPFMRLPYKGEFSPPLIPDYHYISVDRDRYGLEPEIWNTGKDVEGGDDYVEAYKHRFLEVKDNKEFLTFIANNAKEYYKKYCDPSVRIKELLKLLEEI